MTGDPSDIVSTALVLWAFMGLYCALLLAVAATDAIRQRITGGRRRSPAPTARYTHRPTRRGITPGRWR